MAQGPGFAPDGPVPIIHNPASGGGKGSLRFRKAQAMLAVKGIQVEPHETQSPGHAIELAQDLCKEGHPDLLVLGGDGTLSEVANGVLRAGARPRLGLLPAGTGNDFLRDFEIEDLQTAVDRLVLGSERAIDAARIDWDGGHKFMLNVFGTGFVSRAADTCNKRFKWMGGRCYTAAVLREMVRLKNIDTTITMDGKEVSGPMPFVSVCNSIHTGHAMKIAPQARMDDGLLDVMYVDKVGRVELLNVFPKIFSGAHVSHKKVHFARAKKVRIEPAEPSPLLADGEVYGHTPVDVSVLKGALRVVL